MDAKDWYECGAKIGNLVQSAVDSKNFDQLNQSITSAINESVQAVSSSFQRQRRQQDEARRHMQNHTSYRAPGRAYDAVRRFDTGQLWDSFTSDGTQEKGFRKKIKKTLKGIAAIAVGIPLAVICGFTALIFGMMGTMQHPGFFIGAAIFAALTAFFGNMIAQGAAYRRRLRRLEQYMMIVGDREMCTIEELAAATSRSKESVLKDLRQMMQDGMFADAAYLDEAGTCLITSQAAYRQYRETMQEARRREAEEAAKAQQRRNAEKNMASYPEETQQVLQEGREFIEHIHKANERIPEEEMSEKLDQLESVVTRIFQQVAADPESAPDLHKMMSYYLPITRKLVDAYADLSEQRVQGENVAKTRKEIELSLDTINGAFETFLDSFFEDTAWDISSDISALKTMMARDGLTGGRDFTPGTHINSVGTDLTSSGSQQGAAQSASAGAHAAAGAAAGAAAAQQEEQ